MRRSPFITLGVFIGGSAGAFLVTHGVSHWWLNALGLVMLLGAFGWLFWESR